MRKQIKLSLNAGITFGIITIFLFLVGFTSTWRIYWLTFSTTRPPPLSWA